MLKLEIPLNTKGDAFEFDLDCDNISIGRRYDNDIRIMEDCVSAYHAEFIREDGQFYIADRGSFNGTWLNGRKVEGHAEVAAGDTLFFGQLGCSIVDTSSVVDDSFPAGNHSSGGPAVMDAVQPAKAAVKMAVTTVAVHGVPDSSMMKTGETTTPANLLKPVDDHSRYYHSKKGSPVEELSEVAPRPKVGKTTSKGEVLGYVSLAHQLEERHRIDQLAFEKMILEDETNELRKERESLNRDIQSSFEKLHDSEGRIHDLKILEKEMERSLARSERSKFNRKGIYYEGQSDYEVEMETEISICRELISWLQLLDDMMGHYKQNWGTQKVSNHLVSLRERFMALLNGYSVEAFSFENGAKVTAELRPKILLVSVGEIDDPKIKRLASKTARPDGGRVVKTLREGFVYRNRSGDVVIRKADVVVV